MKRNQDHEYVQENGCGALCNITVECKCNSERVVKADGITRVVKAMNDYVDNAECQDYACRFLCFLSAWPEYKPLIEDAGGLVAIATAISNHKENEDIQKFGRLAMKKLMDCE